MRKMTKGIEKIYSQQVSITVVKKYITSVILFLKTCNKCMYFAVVCRQ